MSIKVDLKIFLLVIFLILSGQSKIYLIIFAFTAIHEVGHLICGLILGLKPKTIKIMPMGLSILFKNEQLKWWKELLVCIAGPIVNFFIALITYNIKAQYLIIYTNILIGVFNLLPVIPLDGGRAIKAILKRLLCYKKANKYISLISYATMVVISIIGLFIIIKLNNIFILLTIAYLWVITISENKKNYLKKTIQYYLDIQNRY